MATADTIYAGHAAVAFGRCLHTITFQVLLLHAFEFEQASTQARKPAKTQTVNQASKHTRN